MAVNVKAFLAIEKSLAARLERSWRQVSSQYVADLEEAAAQKNWDRAVQIVDSLDLTPIYDTNSQYIRYASMAALMFGMSRLRSHLKSSNALPGLWSGKLLERGGISLRAQIRGPMTDYLREILLKRLGQLEAEDMLAQQESLQKYDPNQPRAPKGSPDGGQWVKDPEARAAYLSIWAGRSKVVDEDWNPKVLYHGTYGDFGTFDPEKRMGYEGNFNQTMGWWFIEDPKLAAKYVLPDPEVMGMDPKDMATFNDGMWTGANVMPVYVRMQSPLVFKPEPLTEKAFDRLYKKGAIRNDPLPKLRDVEFKRYKERYEGKIDSFTLAYEWWLDHAVSGNNDEKMPVGSRTAVIRALEDSFHDGIIIQDTMGDKTTTKGPATMYVVQQPEHIKSALGNQGTYNLFDTDIRKFDPEQPRAPKGSPIGGRWVGTGSVSGGLTADDITDSSWHDGEARKIPVVIEEDLLEGYTKMKNISVLKNPTQKEIDRWAGRTISRIRWALEPETGNYAVWDAEDAIHKDVMDQLGIETQGWKSTNYDDAVQTRNTIEQIREYVRLAWDLNAISHEDYLVVMAKTSRVSKFDPEQPRAPRGSPIGGQWVKGRFYYEGKTRVMHPISMRTQGAEGGEYEKGQPYKWIYDDGTEVSAADVDRLKKLNVPPGYVNVQLNADKEAPMQAVGTNVKGQVKRFYYSWFHEKNAAEKFSRVQEFDADLDGIRAQILKDIHSPDEKIRSAAEILYLIDQTGFRVGGDGDTKADKQAFGASTLLPSHVRVKGTKVAFSFPGKKGVKITKTVDNQILADIIERRRAALGNVRGKPLLPGTDDDARDYLKAITGKPYQVKDFRTWHGTSEALGYMQKWKTKPRNEKEMKKRRREVVKHVSSYLGNTPAVALKNYIDPSVWEWWEPQADETDDA